MVRNNPTSLKDEGGLGPLDDEMAVKYLRGLIAKKPDIKDDKLISKLKEKFPKCATTKQNTMQLITAAKMTGAKTTSALGAVRGATEAKVKVAKEKEAKITKQRDDEDKQDAIDFIWSTQVGYKILKSSTNGSEKNIGSAAINELVRRNDTIFNGRDGLRRAIKNLDSHSASELRNIFENSITQHQISVTNIYRGMNGSKDFLAMAMNNADYQPQTFTAASASEDVAKTFAKYPSGHPILRN